MPRELPQGLSQLLQPATRFAESHATVKLETAIGVLYMATVPLMIDGIRYTPDLRESGNLKQSLNQPADRIEFSIQNVDRLFGLNFLAVIAALEGATASAGRYWRDLRNGAEYHKQRIKGVIVDAKGTNSSCRLTLVSELYASRQIGGRLVARNCQNRFKDPASCGYVGPLTTCNKLYASSDGCAGRSRQFRYEGMIYIQ